MLLKLLLEESFSMLLLKKTSSCCSHVVADRKLSLAIKGASSCN